MLRDHIKWILFLSSYIPLFAIIMIRNYTETNLLIVLGALTAFALIILAIVIWRSNKQSGDPMKVEKIENVNRIGLEYFVTYIIPFLAIDFLKLTDIISILILFGIMGFIYTRSDLVYMNPVLNLAKFNVYKVIAKGEEYVIITRKPRNLVNTEEVIELGDNVLLGKNK